MFEIIVTLITMGGKEYKSDPIEVTGWRGALVEALEYAINHEDPTVMIKAITRIDI